MVKGCSAKWQMFKCSGGGAGCRRGEHLVQREGASDEFVDVDGPVAVHIQLCHDLQHPLQIVTATATVCLLPH